MAHVWIAGTHVEGYEKDFVPSTVRADVVAGVAGAGVGGAGVAGRGVPLGVIGIGVIGLGVGVRSVVVRFRSTHDSFVSTTLVNSTRTTSLLP